MRAFLICAFIAYCSAAELYEIPVRHCDGSTSVKKVEIEGCKNGPPCELPKNSNTTVKVYHSAPHDASNLKIGVSGLVAETELPFPGLDRKVCNQEWNKGYCPQKGGQDYVLTVNLPILSFFPTIDTTAFIRVFDDDASNEKDELMACMKVDIKVINNPNEPQQSERPKDEDDDDE